MEELNHKIDERSGELIQSTREIIRIRSVQGEPKKNTPYGGDVGRCLKYALELAGKLGFRTVNLDGYIGYAEYGEGDDYVGVLGHLDVVPEGGGWKYPPYGGELHDGKIYGRGTLDDKGPIIAALYGLKAVKDLHLPLTKRVRILFGTNEETGCHEMSYYNEREKPPVAGFTPDGQYPIIYAEKGITLFDIAKDLHNPGIIRGIQGGNRPNMVPDYAEARLSMDAAGVRKAIAAFPLKDGFTLTAEEKEEETLVKCGGRSAHGSTPEEGKNAVMELFAFLETLIKEDGGAMDFIRFCNRHIGFETDGASFGCSLTDEPSGGLSFNVGVVKMNEKKISLSLNLRYPVTHTYEEMMSGFSRTLEGSGIRVENMEVQKPLYFDKNHPLIRTLETVYQEETGLEPELLAIGGGTYAKDLPNIVAFGPIFPGEPDLDHQANEYIAVGNLIKNAKIYARAIYELAK